MKRREFFKLMASTSASYMVLKLTACGPAAAGEGALRVDVKDGDTVVIYDMEMEGWSTLGTGMLGPNGTLKAGVVEANKTITLDYVQDPHGHKFTLTPEHFTKLRKGQPISVFTTKADDHYHEVRIDPRKNRIPGSAGITMPVDPAAGGAGDSSSKASGYATLDEKDKLYVAGTEDLDEASVEYCQDTPENCDDDTGSWNPMKRYAARRDKQIFVSDDILTLDDAKSELPLSVRAKTKKDGVALRLLLKLVGK